MGLQKWKIITLTVKLENLQKSFNSNFLCTLFFVSPTNDSEEPNNDMCVKFLSRVLQSRKKREILTEPLVATYLHLKWQDLKLFFYAHLIVVTLTLVFCLTLLTTIMVDMNSCVKGSKIFFILNLLVPHPIS